MSTLRIQLLSNFQLVHNGVPVTTINQARMQALLAYLVLHRDAMVARQQLAFLFWPDTSEAQAQTNLRQLLHHLRRAWPAVGEFVQIEARHLQWKPAVICHIDIQIFEAALAQATTALQGKQLDAARTALAEAVAVYTGDLLPACYEEWLLLERERLRQRFLQALAQVVALYEGERNYPLAIHHAQRLLQADPLQEATYQRLMQLYALHGDRTGALRTYQSCVTVLRRELDVAPNAALQALYARLVKLEQPLAPLSRRANPQERLIGRQAAWVKLQVAWQTTLGGQSHFVCISGEAGIGKTRLAEELLTWARQQGITTAHSRSYAAEGELAYVPVIEWLRSAALQSTLLHLDAVWRTELARLLPELAPQPSALQRPSAATERWQRQRLFEAMARALLGAKPPLLLVIDDLQWVDPETVEWLHYLLRFDPKARLLLVGTVRLEEVDDPHALTALLLQLRRAGQVTELALDRLDAAETAALAAQAANQPLEAKSVTQIYEQTAGNPLFVVEMVRAALRGAEAGQEHQGLLTPFLSGTDFPTHLPPKVQAVLQARLNQLSPPARALANLAAVIGRAFTFDEVARAGDSDPEGVVRALDELWQRRIIREHGINAYDFSHDRMRDVAYVEMSPARRRAHHARVAEAFVQLYQSDLDAISAILAHHYAQASMAPQAIAWYQQAATASEKRFDFRSAIHYLDAALALQQQLPPTKQRTAQELTLLLTKADNWAITHGFTAPAVAQVNAQVEPLVELIDDVELRFRALQRLRQFYGASGHMAKAQSYAEQLLDIALPREEPRLLQAAYQANGVVNLQLGRLAVAKQQLSQGEALTRTKRTAPALTQDSHGSRASLLANLALTLWLLGYPEQALSQISEAIAVAETLKHPFQLSIVLFFATLLYAHMRAATLIVAPMTRVLSVGAQYDIRISNLAGRLAQGWLLAQQGDFAAGIGDMRASIDGYKSFNYMMFQTHRLGLLVEVQLQAKQAAAAAATLAEAFALSVQSGQCSWDADLYRLKGDLLCAMNGAPADAIAAYEQAIHLARQQAAKVLELRATVSLARLWQQQGKPATAYQRLQEIYNWFSEGFTTADLQAAQALLEELNQST